MNIPCKLLQISVSKKMVLSGEMNAGASTLHVIPVTMNSRKYKAYFDLFVSKFILFRMKSICGEENKLSTSRCARRISHAVKIENTTFIVNMMQFGRW